MDSNLKAAMVGAIVGSVFAGGITIWTFNEQLKINEEASQLYLSTETLKLIDKRSFWIDSLLFSYECEDISDNFKDRYDFYFKEIVSEWNGTYAASHVLITNNFKNEQQKIGLQQSLLNIENDFEELQKILQYARYYEEETFTCESDERQAEVQTLYNGLKTHIDEYMKAINSDLDTKNYIPN